MPHAPTIAQLRPPRSEDLAKIFEDYAAQAREGRITGYSGILIRPGGEYSVVGWQAEGTDAFREMGMHLTMAFDCWRNSLKD